MISVHTVDGRRIDTTMTGEEWAQEVFVNERTWVELPPYGALVQVAHVTSVVPYGDELKDRQ